MSEQAHQNLVDSNSRLLEKTLFEFACIALSSVMCFAAIQVFVVYGVYTVIFIELGIALISMFLFYFSRYRNNYRLAKIPFILLILAAAVYFWVNSSYFYPPVAIGVVGVLIIFIILIPYKLRYFSLSFSILFLLGLVMLAQYKKPSPYMTDGEVTSTITYSVISISIIFLIWILKVEFDRERKKTGDQNKELEYLNDVNKISIIDKDNIINELRSTRDQLIESEKLASIGKLTAGLAHELNNPLNYIGGIVNPVKRDIDDLKKFIDPKHKKESDELLEEIYSLLNNVSIGTKKASTIIDNLVRMAPSNAVVSPVDFSKTDINEVIRSTVYVMEKSNLDVRFNQYLEKDIYISGNPVELNQVFVGLIQNSIQAVAPPNKPIIEIRTKTRDKSVIISFSDNGIGINKTDQNRVFEPFYTTKNPGEGTGLGLFIAYSIIKKHSGEIKIESDPGLGTTVTLFLPRF